MTSKEYVAWLEVSLCTALSTIERQENLICRLMSENINLGKELYAATDNLIHSPYVVNTKEHKV